MNKNNKLLVSILSLTYNHEKYIGQALDSFLMQKCDFDYEIIIGEDCSTDNTREIILDYQKKKPNSIIKIITSEKNVGATRNGIRAYNAAKGKYIALCEGDDYWTDPYKLQKQVDFLEANSDFAMCAHSIVVWNSNTGKKVVSDYGDKVITHKDLALGAYISTLSVVFRNVLTDIPEWFFSVFAGDYSLFLLVTKYGKVKFLPDVMGVYRIHENNIWANNHILINQIKWQQTLNILITNFDSEIQDNLLKQQKKLLIKIEKNINRSLDEINSLKRLLLKIKNSRSYKLGNWIINKIKFLR
jgi:glycosyltransferase involved in cell wall biosynthesis